MRMDEGGSEAPPAASSPAVDARLKELYPFVDESKAPLPRSWSGADKCPFLGLSHDNLRLTYRGQGKNHKDAGAVRTAAPIPPTAGLYYFEVRVVSKGRDGYMGVGLCHKDVSMQRLPGWEKGSFGYHGDDGNAFASSGNGAVYGPTFGTGDVIGCGLNLVSRTAFYTKNGHHLGTAFKELALADLYPTVGLQTPGEVVDTNFGQAPFLYDLRADLRRARQQVLSSMESQSLSRVLEPSPKEAMDRLVASFLVHHGHAQAAQAFDTVTGQSCSSELGAMRSRQELLSLVRAGRLSSAMEQVGRAHPGLLQRRPTLLFLLHLQHLTELIAAPDSGPSTRDTSSPLVSGPSVGRRSSRHTSPSPAANGASSNGASAAAAATVASDVTMEETGEEEEAASVSSNGTANGNGVCAPPAAPTPPVFTIPSAALPGNLESILSFGKELRRFFDENIAGKEPDADRHQQRMQEVFSLLAYPEPMKSPLAHLLSPSQREPVASALNSAILQEEGGTARPALETLALHARSLRRRLAQEGLGAAAFAHPLP